MNDWRNTLGALRDTLPEGAPIASSDESAASPSQKEITLRVSRSTKGRAGKVATLIEGFPGESGDDLTLVKDTAATLRQRLGTGGSHRDCEILIQGDRRQEVATLLKSLGFKVKG